MDDRELSWTSFLAWLLDPERSGAVAACAARALRDVLIDHPAVRAPHERCAEALHRFASGTPEPWWSKAEVTRGRSRFDVLAAFKTGAGNVHLLIENKIHAGESAKQMARYVDAAERDTPAGTALLPLFIALGSEPPVATTCAWAIVLNREHARRWLVRTREEAVGAGAAHPPLLQDYIDLLQLWMLTDQLRRTHWREIEALEAGAAKPPGWSRVERWLNVGNEAFYAAVGSSPVLAETFARLGMGSCTFESTLNQTTGFQFYREHWRIGEPLLLPKGFEVHYESARRGELFIHVEISPYEGGIDRDPQRLTALAAPLASKTRVQASIRDRASAQARQNPWMGATLSRCGDPARAGTLAAIKYTLRKDEAAVTPEECAYFFARLVEATVGMIQDELDMERARLSCVARSPELEELA